ncbi:MAG: ankyrin repeat domain-containing protein [Treponema sp.]|nr:ankyrin repeat domain-containing protein [Treponema sp.]
MKKFLSFFVILQIFLTGTAFSQDKLKQIKEYSVDVLYEKLRSGDKDVYNAVSQKKVNLNRENLLGYTVLSYAAIDNEYELAKMLLKSGAKPDYGLNFPLYQICWASEKPKNQNEMIKLLIAYGANVNKKQKNTNDTPLMATIKKQGGKYAKLLIQYGAKVNVVNSEGETPLILAVDYYANLIDVSLVQYLISQGSDVNVITKTGHTALSIAAYNGYPLILRQLLENGADVKITKKNKNEIPILNACYNGEIECVNLLLQYGADITVKDSYGSTALIMACISKDSPELVKLCIQKGCQVNYVDPSTGYTPFILAAIWNHPKQMKALYEAGANINAENPDVGNTLMFIISNGIKEPNPPYYPASELGGAICGLELGMNVNVRNSRGETPRSYAVKYINNTNNPQKIKEYCQIIELIAQKENRYPYILSFHEAVITGKTDIVKKYLSNSYLNVEEPDAEGNTALYYAQHFNHKDIEKLLKNAGATK